MLVLALLQAALKPARQGLHKDLSLHPWTTLETSDKQEPLLEPKGSAALCARKAENHHAELKLGVSITPMRRQGVLESNRGEQDLLISFYMILPVFLSLKRKVLNPWDWLKWSRELCGLKPPTS